jgi:outer membrane protein assembly factor BamB
MMYVGTMEGRLAAINLADQSKLWAEPLKVQAQSGLFGCSSVLGCGGGTAKVAIYGTPVVSDNLVFVAGYNGKIYAYNTTNLAMRWTYPVDGYLNSFVGSLVIDNNKLFIGDSDGWVYALNATTGESLNKFQTGDKIWGTPTVDGDTLYIGSFDKKLYALNTADLTLKWSFATEGSIIAKPLVNNGVVYIGSFDKNLYAINAADGSLKWKFTGGNWFWASPAIVDGTLFAGCLDGKIYPLNADTGALAGSVYSVESLLSAPPVVVGDEVVFATHNGLIIKINAATMALAQIAVTNFSIDGAITVNEGIIYIQAPDLTLQCIDFNTGAFKTPISLISG